MVFASKRLKELEKKVEGTESIIKELLSKNDAISRKNKELEDRILILESTPEKEGAQRQDEQINNWINSQR